MKTEEMIKALEEKGYKIEEPKNRFSKVKPSKDKNVLLENKNSEALIECLCDGISLNDSEWFNAYDAGQFFINGNIQPVELFINRKWIQVDKAIKGRFLK